jgi:malonyl-CoA O-methyltransferase
MLRDGCPLLDRALLKRHLRQARARGEGDFLAREIDQRMQARLAYIRFAPQRILALGRVVDLGHRYPAAHCSCVGEAIAGTQSLPGGSVDLVWANLFEFWRHDWAQTLQEARRVLRPGGLLMLSAFGPNTLWEMRAGLDIPEALPSCLDLRALGDLLFCSGFADTVADTERLTLTYVRLGTLFADLRAVAPDLFFSACRAHADRPRWQKLLRHYETCRAARADEKFPVQVEILHAHAWAPTDAHRQRRCASDNAGYALLHKA